MVRLLIASAVRFYRDGLAELLPATGTVEVIATAADWAEVLDATAAYEPAVALVDAALVPQHESLHELKALSARTKVMVVALSSSVEHAVEWVEAGADGYVPQDASLAELRTAVERIVHGEFSCSPKVTARLFGRVADLSRLAAPATDAASGHVLTPREHEVAGLIAAGLSNKGISRRLGIGVATTKNHVHNILSKLRLERRTQVAAWQNGRRPTGTAIPRY